MAPTPVPALTPVPGPAPDPCVLPAGTEKSRGVQALAVSPDRRYLAVSEAAGERPVLAVLELTAERARLRKVLAAEELPARQAVSLAFSPDSRLLAAATAPPDGHLACWFWEKQQLVATVRVPAAGDGPCQVMAPAPPAPKPPNPGCAGGSALIVNAPVRS